MLLRWWWWWCKNMFSSPLQCYHKWRHTLLVIVKSFTEGGTRMQIIFYSGTKIKRFKCALRWTAVTALAIINFGLIYATLEIWSKLLLLVCKLCHSWAGYQVVLAEINCSSIGARRSIVAICHSGTVRPSCFRGLPGHQEHIVKDQGGLHWEGGREAWTIYAMDKVLLQGLASHWSTPLFLLV